MSGNSDDDAIDKLDLARRLLESLPRNTESIDACLLDSLAVTTDIIMAEIEQRQIMVARLSQLVKILQAGRAGPNSYPRDRPAGQRPTARKGS